MAVTALASATDLLARYDSRTVAQLASDSNTAVASPSADPNIAAALLDAWAEIYATITARARVDVTDVDELVADNDALLTRLNCDLAMELLANRRPGTGVGDRLQVRIDNARDMLARIRDGSMLLNLDSARTAAKPAKVRPLESDSIERWPVTNSRLYPTRVDPGQP